MAILVVALGGGLGAVLRYACIRYFERTQRPFYLSTLLINIVGSFTMGVALQFANENPHLGLFLATGVLGGFTTFSSFAYDVLRLFEQQEKKVGMIYIVSTLLLGILAVSIGYYVAI